MFGAAGAGQVIASFFVFNPDLVSRTVVKAGMLNPAMIVNPRT